MRRKITLNGIEAVCLYDDETNQVGMHLSLEDSTVHVEEGDQEVGSITTCLGGGLELCDRRISEEHPRTVFFMGARTLWEAFQRALEETRDREPEDPDADQLKAAVEKHKDEIAKIE